MILVYKPRYISYKLVFVTTPTIIPAHAVAGAPHSVVHAPDVNASKEKLFPFLLRQTDKK